jgi:hypothetical protein
MSHELIAFDYKGEIQQAEEAGTEATRPEAIPGDAALKIAAEERIELTEEDVGSSIPNSTTCISTPAHAVQNLRLRKVTDKHILSMLIVVYFLQAMDKTRTFSDFACTVAAFLFLWVSLFF